MKKLVAIFLEMAMVGNLMSVGYTNIPTEEVTQTIVETEEIHVLTDEELSKLYICKEDIRHDTCLELTQEEAWMLMKVACAEGGSEDVLAQAYIMAVILNRLKDDNFPSSIKEILYQENPRQFSVMFDGRYEETEPTVASHLALAKIEANEIDIDDLYFEAVWVTDSWQSQHRDFDFEYEGTRYYK